MKIYDLIDKGNRIEVFAKGVIEKNAALSLAKSFEIKSVKVRGKSGDVIIIRYSWIPETENINHIAKRFEQWIDRNYERI